ncbi:MAG: (Fe-S)-binding protein, partial [Acidaminococcaceae bacterium]|nr:(Fe-S)-binding protein [Acidaminococcaceae bacterium]
MKLSMKKILPIVLTASLVAACGGATAKQQTAPEKKAEAKPAATAQVHTDGSKYIPMDKRTGAKSVVYFTRDLSAKGLQKIYEKVNQDITGKVAIKLHTGEKNGPNIIP